MPRSRSVGTELRHGETESADERRDRSDVSGTTPHGTPSELPPVTGSARDGTGGGAAPGLRREDGAILARGLHWIVALSIVLLHLAAGLTVVLLENPTARILAVSAATGGTVALALFAYTTIRERGHRERRLRERRDDYRLLTTRLGFWVRERDADQLDAVLTQARILAEPDVVEAVRSLKERVDRGEPHGEALDEALLRLRRPFWPDEVD